MHAAGFQASEEVLGDTGEGLNTSPVQSEHVVGAYEVCAKDLYPRILDTARGCVREAHEMTLSLTLGEVRHGCIAITSVCREPGSEGSGKDVTEPSVMLRLEVEARQDGGAFVLPSGGLDSRVDVRLLNLVIQASSFGVRRIAQPAVLTRGLETVHRERTV
ncbi:hypothetical protein ABZ178_02965 [Streptomyces massasporeus]|uniref:hypothetical protein n=1 Tax=Streptomyces massasporeus TaxID=67324 RepID=UPI0033AA5881